MQKAVFIGADPQVAEIVRLGICLRWPEVTPLVATTGTGGLELVKEESPDLVLLRPDAISYRQSLCRRLMGRKRPLITSNSPAGPMSHDRHRRTGDTGVF